MSIFDSLKVAVTGTSTATLTLTLPDSIGTVTLTLAPMTRENRAWAAAAAKVPPGRATPKNPTPEQEERAEAERLATYADAMIAGGIVRGWSGMVIGNTDVAYTPEVAAEFLRWAAVPGRGWIINRIAEIAFNPANFFSTTAAEETAKNSVGG